MRVRFKDKHGQREFLKEVLVRTNCSSLKTFEQFGFDVPYSTMKNYSNESRLLPKEFFEQLCYISKIDSNILNVEFVEDNWGQKKGGLKSKR